MDDPDSPVQIWLEFEAIDLQHDDRINFGDIVAQDKWISCANDLFKIFYKKIATWFHIVLVLYNFNQFVTFMTFLHFQKISKNRTNREKFKSGVKKNGVTRD